MVFLSLLILIVAIALPYINKLISPILLARIASIAFIFSGVLSFNTLYIQSIGSGLGIYSGLFHVTTVSQLLDTFIFITASIILISWPSIRPVLVSSANVQSANSELSIKSQTNASQYSLIVLFSTLGASLLISSVDLISMYLSIELQSFGVYILSTLYRNSESATSAGLKYFLLGCLSSCLILLGAGLIYTFTGLTNFESLYSLVSVSESSYITGYSSGLFLGLIIIIIGFLFKIAAAPLHNWSIDVYDDSPTIVTIWLTVMPKISIIIFILELYSQIGLVSSTPSSILIPNLTEIFSAINPITAPYGTATISYNLLSENITNILKNLLLISSLLSLIIGTIVCLAQTKIKRLLAYSTITHVGFVLLALAINTQQSVDSLIFYIIQYSLTNLNTFLIILALGYIIKNSVVTLSHNTSKSIVQCDNTKGIDLNAGQRDIQYISELKGQFFANPLLSICLTVCLFSMAGFNYTIIQL